MRTVLVLTAVFATLSAPLAAQSAAEVTVGDERIDGTRLQPGTWSLRFVRGDSDAAQDVAKVESSLVRIQVNGESGFQFVQMASSPRGPVADTLVFLARTLQPISHRSHTPTRTLDLAFHGKHVAGDAKPVDGEPVKIDQTMDVAAFDGGILDLLFGAFALTPGTEAVLPIYIYENGGPLRVHFRVVERTEFSLHGVERPAFLLSVDYPFGKGQLWIDAETRHPLGAEITTPNGDKTRLVR